MPPPLWSAALDYIFEINGEATHKLDRDRARQVVRAVRLAGEKPTPSEVRAKVADLWYPGWEVAGSMTRECWRQVFRAKSAFPRGVHSEPVHFLAILAGDRTAGLLTSQLEEAARSYIEQGDVEAETRFSDLAKAVRELAAMRSAEAVPPPI